MPPDSSHPVSTQRALRYEAGSYRDRDGRVFYDIESDVPLYYEDRRAEPLSEDAP